MSGLHPELAVLYAKRPQVIKPGLARIEAALAALGPEPLLAHPTVLVGGTNGKGTTTGFLWQLLAALGVRVGLFTSPHLVHFAERIQTNHARIDDPLLLDELASLRRDLPPAVYEPLSFFEVNTLLALRLFRRLGTDIDLLEVGLGGRWDSTNATRPLLSLITSIGLDHQEFLGDTTSAIAGEKAGIMRPGRPTLWGGDNAGDPGAVATLRQAAAACGAPFWELGRHFGSEGGDAWVRLPGCAPVRAGLPTAAERWPEFLRENYLKAFAALVWLLHAPELAAARQRLGLADPAAAAARAVSGFAAAPTPPSMRARFESLTVPAPPGAAPGAASSRPLLLDVCHNVDGARALVQGLRGTGVTAAGPVPGLVSILADKDYAAVLDILRPALRPLRLFAVQSERSWRREHLPERHRDLPFHQTFAEAWRASDGGGDQPTVVCGSVYALGEVCSALGIDTLA